MNLKKKVSRVITIIYDILSLFWCYIITSTLVYYIPKIQMNEHSIGIIGGADTPTAIFIMGRLLNCAFSIPFVILSVVTVFLLTFQIFKKHVNQKFSILLCVFLTILIILFMLIPIRSYIVSLYSLIGNLSIIKFLQFFYIILSLGIIVTNILFAINRRSKTQ